MSCRPLSSLMFMLPPPRSLPHLQTSNLSKPSVLWNEFFKSSLLAFLTVSLLPSLSKHVSVRSWGTCGSGAFRYTYLTSLIVHIFYSLSGFSCFQIRQVTRIPGLLSNSLGILWLWDFLLCISGHSSPQTKGSHSYRSARMWPFSSQAGVPTRSSLLLWDGHQSREEQTVYNSSKEGAF